VLALGGGAVLSAQTRALLRGGRGVFLSAGMAEGVRRTGLSSARPLLAGVNPRATLAALLDARLPLYREHATAEVATARRSPAEVTADVRAEAAVHRNPGHRVVRTFVRVVARHVSDQPGGEQADVVEAAAVSKHLVERSHAPGGSVTAAVGEAGGAEGFCANESGTKGNSCPLLKNRNRAKS